MSSSSRVIDLVDGVGRVILCWRPALSSVSYKQLVCILEYLEAVLRVSFF
jgi:hypothetical protein